MSKSQHQVLIQRLRNQAAIAREERAKADALFSSIGQGAIATDEHAKITRVNQVALDILGYERAELLGAWFPKIIRPVHEDNTIVAVADRPITRAFVSGDTITQRMSYLRKDGSKVAVLITVSPIIMRGKPIGAIEIIRDITAELASDRLKTDFISVASHQLRTPLAAINTYSQMLNAGYVGELNEDQQAFMGIILSAVNRMNELISTLLNITRIEAGSITLEIESLQLDVMVQELLNEFRAAAAEKDITLKFDVSKKLPPVESDRLLVKEIYSNLLSNAIKYTPAGGKVTVKLTVQNNNLVFSVKDTGYGIPASDQPLIFTKFFRANNILKTEVSGTGLGLYLIKVLAENLNGEVWFKSKENNGSIFYFSLPITGSTPRTGTFRLESK